MIKSQKLCNERIQKKKKFNFYKTFKKDILKNEIIMKTLVIPIKFYKFIISFITIFTN